MADKLFPFHHHGVAGIVAALKSHDHIRMFRQQIYDLAFAFISPLGSYDNDVRHVLLLNRSGSKILYA